MTISRRLRFEILRRDGHACRYCGAKAPDVALTVDHVVPVTLGGGDEPNNLVAACGPCNAGKSSIAPDSALIEDVDTAALLMKKALERASEIRRQDREEMDRALAHFDLNWRRWGVGPSANRTPLWRTDGWRDTIEALVGAGLDIHEIVAMIPTAMNSKADPQRKWNYLCGCAWREVSVRQEIARQLVEDGEV